MAEFTINNQQLPPGMTPAETYEPGDIIAITWDGGYDDQASLEMKDLQTIIKVPGVDSQVFNSYLERIDLYDAETDVFTTMFVSRFVLRNIPTTWLQTLQTTGQITAPFEDVLPYLFDKLLNQPAADLRQA